MRIRSEQMAEFEKLASTSFEGSVTEHLRKVHAGVLVRFAGGQSAIGELPEAKLRRYARFAIEKGRGYGLIWQSSLAAFAAIAFVTAPNFDAHPAIRAELTNPLVPNNAKPDHLCAMVPETVWQEVRERYNPSEWPEA